MKISLTEEWHVDYHKTDGIKIGRAMELCNGWNKGPTSALYQYGKAGVYVQSNHARYLLEIEQALHPEAFNLVGEVNQLDRRHLNNLINYFTDLGEENGVITGWSIKPGNNYMIPSAWEFEITKIAI